MQEKQYMSYREILNQGRVWIAKLLFRAHGFLKTLQK